LPFFTINVPEVKKGKKHERLSADSILKNQIEVVLSLNRFQPGGYLFIYWAYSDIY